MKAPHEFKGTINTRQMAQQKLLVPARNDKDISIRAHNLEHAHEKYINLHN